MTDCDAWEERERKLNLHAMVYLIIVLALFPRLSHCHVFAKVTAGLRHLWPEEDLRKIEYLFPIQVLTVGLRCVWKGNSEACNFREETADPLKIGG